MEENIEKKPIKTVSKKSFIITVAALLAVIVALAVGLVLALVLGGNKGENGNNGDNTPSIYESDDGFWVINGVKTNLKTNGEIDNGTVQDENPQGLNFFLNAGGTYTVAAGDAKLLTEIVIPSTYKGIPVTEIDAMGFGNENTARPLVSITIPDSITKIGHYAFFNCTSFTSIVIPDSVTSIGEYAFYGCSSLTSIVVDENNGCYKSINENLYTKDGKTLVQYAIGKSDTAFEIPSSVTSIGGGAFGYCTNLTSIVIPDSVTSIGWYAFYSCSSLTSIVIPDSVTSIGSYAFDVCRSLTDIYYTGSKEEWEAIDILYYGNDELIYATIHYNYVP